MTEKLYFYSVSFSNENETTMLNEISSIRNNPSGKMYFVTGAVKEATF